MTEQPDPVVIHNDPGDTPSRRTGLRDQLAEALYERERPPRDPAWADAYAMDREVFEPMADAVLAVLHREWPWLQAEAEEMNQARAEIDRLGAEIRQYTENESADAAAGSYAHRAETVEAQLAAAADLIADHEGDEWAAHSATTALRGILNREQRAEAEDATRTTANNPATSKDQ